MGVESSRGRGITRRDFLKMSGAGLAGAGLLGSTACGGPPGSGPVELTFWSWVPDIINEVKLFEEAHPDIKIKYVNAGQGTPQYTKLRTALKAGSGAPDVVQIEFQYIPTFQQIDALADISQHGASEVEDDFVDWTWGQVSEGSAVYAIPQDSGPMGLLYRKDIFDEYGLKVPETWEEFAQEASKLHEANPDLYLTDFPPNDGGWFTALLWQAGSRPFEGSGTELTININDAAAKKVAEYWQELFDAGTVDTAPSFNNEWYSALDRGKYAVWTSAAWVRCSFPGSPSRARASGARLPCPSGTRGSRSRPTGEARPVRSPPRANTLRRRPSSRSGSTTTRNPRRCSPTRASSSRRSRAS
jgi:multiple sugar transport system substrate-binding protein